MVASWAHVDLVAGPDILHGPIVASTLHCSTTTGSNLEVKFAVF